MRMLANTVGEEIFHHTIIDYLIKYKDSNVDHEQLWNEFEPVNPFKQDKISLGTIFNSWIMQKGIPLIKVSRCNERKNCKNVMLLKQVHYSGYSGDSSALSPSVWYVPVQYALIRYKN